MAILNHAVKFYELPTNPCHKVGSIRKKHADEMLFWTSDEFNKFISTFTNPLYFTTFNLFFYSGIRLGELLALTPDDVDFINSTIDINKSFQLFEGKILITPPKTPKSKRIVTIPRFITDIIYSYTQMLFDLKHDTRLFPTGKSQLYNVMKTHSKMADVKKIRIHDLRHSHASLLIEHNVNPMIIQERLGHEKIETTLGTYSHLYPNKQARIAYMLNELNPNYTITTQKFVNQNDTVKYKNALLLNTNLEYQEVIDDIEIIQSIE